MNLLFQAKFYNLLMWMRKIKRERLYLSTAWKVSVFEVFLVPIFPHLNWIRIDTPYLFKFSPIAGKYGPEKLRIRTFFTQWRIQNLRYFSIKRSSISARNSYKSYLFLSSSFRMPLNLYRRILSCKTQKIDGFQKFTDRSTIFWNAIELLQTLIHRN